jgi:hypothetical protein
VKKDAGRTAATCSGFRPGPIGESYEVRFSDGRPSVFFCWDDEASRRLRPEQLDSEKALEQAKAFARAERDSLGRKAHHGS